MAEMSHSAETERFSAPPARRHRRFLLALHATWKWARRNPRRIITVLCCTLILGGAGSLWIKPWLVGTYHWRRAQSALAAGDLPRARGHLQESLQIWPDHAQARFLLAQTYRRADDLESWQIHLQKAGRLGWTSELLQLEQDLAQAQCGALRVVEPRLLAYLDRGHPHEELIFEALAKGYLESYRLRDVARCATRWKQHDPHNWQAPYFCGRAFELHMAYDEAIEQYRQAHSLRPEEPQVALSLANMLAFQGEFPEALESFQARLINEPTNTAALLGTAYCQRGLGDNEAALATLDRLLAQDSTHAKGTFLRGQIELERGQPGQALGWLRLAEERMPQDAKVLFVLSRCLRLLDRNEESLRYQHAWVQRKDDLGRLAQLTLEIDAKPENITPRLEAGKLLQGLGQHKEAIRWYQTILQIDPSHRPTHESLALCFDKLGAPARAEYHRQAAAGKLGSEGMPQPRK